MTDSNLLKILFIEDLPSDVDLAVLGLRKEKLKFDFTTVCTRVDLIKALEDFKPDIIISDYLMPSFNGLQALKVVKEFDPDIPFILFTGSVNEETAAECIKSGAEDYVIKEHMTRLPFALKEALEQKSIRTEKKASELLLKENEEKLQSIFSATPVGIGLEVEGRFIEVNDTFCRMTGYSRNEIIGKSMAMIYPEDEEFKSVRDEKNKQIEQTGTGSVETRLKCKDGRVLNTIFTSTPLDTSDLSKGLTFSILDITRRKKIEDELAKTSKTLSTLIGNLQGIVYRCVNDKNWTMQFLSEGTRELTGYSPEDLINNNKLSYNDLIHIDDRDFVWNDVQTAVMAKKHYQLIYRIITRSEEIKWVWEKGEGIFSQNGELEFLEGFITDITGNKQAEELLRKSEEKYRGIFENVQDVYFETSIEGTILQVSPSVEILTKGQYQTIDLIGKLISDFYSEPEERHTLLALLREKGATSDFEIILKNRDGTHVPCSLSAKFCLDIRGVPEKIIGSIHDITDRKNATEKLKLAKEKAEASDRLKTEFLNNISHELRTPLNGILGFAEVMSQPDLSEKDKRDSFSMLHESSDRLLDTITNYMDISLMTSGSMTVHYKNFIPAQVLREIFDNYKLKCLNRHLEFSLEIPEHTENLPVNSDPEIFRKIVSHLLNNAIKFTEIGGITYGYCINKGELEFFVKDTGIGIRKDSISKIFEPFVKEDRGPTKLTEGSGLGLSIAKGMADIIKGNLRVESEPGEGSKFFFTIPFRKDNDIILPGTPSRENKITESETVILIAEDDDTNFYYLNAILAREKGITILHAVNGRETIELFKANPDIQLVLMDMKMPEIDGFEATRQIKLLKKEIPVIAITAYAMSGDEERVLAAGCDSYLSKPISKKNLLEKIAMYITI